MFVARQSGHIQQDITRNWSSWNFGQEGFHGTREQLDALLDQISDDQPFWISGFEIYPNDLSSFEFGELYPNYWVAIDNVNAAGGLSCVNLKSETLESAIEEAAEASYWGEGNKFDATVAKLVYSEGDIHIFEIND